MSDELKIKRGHKKAAFTKSINKLRRAVYLKDDSIIPDLLMIIQQEFDSFQLAHDEYHETLTEEAFIEESEQYFELLDESYVVALKELGSYREGITRPDENVLAQVLSLLRMEIEKFDGNPMNYYNFVAVFNECVDKQISDCQTKLIRCSNLQQEMPRMLSAHVLVPVDLRDTQMPVLFGKIVLATIILFVPHFLKDYVMAVRSNPL